MKKSWIIILIALVIFIGIIIGVYFFNRKKDLDKNIVENEINIVSEKVTDECIEEYEQIQKQARLDIEVNSGEEKISPNCLITLKRYYKECEHLINEYMDIPQDLVNKGEEDLQKQYPNWEIQKYSSTDIILYKEFDSSCGQHFILRNDNGKITVYKINDDNQEEVYEKTEISIDYLTETDKIEIQNGIRVQGIEELNQLIENFE